MPGWPVFPLAALARPRCYCARVVPDLVRILGTSGSYLGERKVESSIVERATLSDKLV